MNDIFSSAIEQFGHELLREPNGLVFNANFNAVATSLLREDEKIGRLIPDV